MNQNGLYLCAVEYRFDRRSALDGIFPPTQFKTTYFAFKDDSCIISVTTGGDDDFCMIERAIHVVSFSEHAPRSANNRYSTFLAQTDANATRETVTSHYTIDSTGAVQKPCSNGNECWNGHNASRRELDVN